MNDGWTPAAGFSKYEVNKLGQIRNKLTKRELSLNPESNGYVKVSIFNDDNKRKHVRMHILIAQTYIPNPSDKITVNHKNKIRNDNSLNNLEWATYLEQSTHKIDKTKKKKINGRPVWQCDVNTHEKIKLFVSANEAARQISKKEPVIGSTISSVALGNKDKKGNLIKSWYGYWWQYADLVIENLENEIWMKLECIKTKNDYQISNHGRIMGKCSRIYNKQCDDSGYKTCSIDSKVYKVHVLVAKTFLPNPDNHPVVNHINGNKKDSHVNNLEWTTHSLNTIHAGENNLTKSPIRTIEAYDIDGVFSGRWRTMSAAEKETGACVQNISMVCKGINGRCKRDFTNGYYWKYADEDRYILGVRAYDRSGKLCGQWLDVKTAAKYLKCHVGTIYSVCNGSRKTVNNYITKREELKLGDVMGFIC